VLRRHIRDAIIDPRPGGAWHAEVNPGGEPVTLLVVKLWKMSCYNGRMCMEMMKRLWLLMANIM
jgi:hypothetical protein